MAWCRGVRPTALLRLPDKPPSLPLPSAARRSASLVGLAEGAKGVSGAPSPTGQAVQVLLGPLKEMLESLTLQQEVMREMVRRARGV